MQRLYFGPDHLLRQLDYVTEVMHVQFELLKAGGVADAGRLEVPGGDLHEGGGLSGQLVDLDEARAAAAAEV